MAIRVPKAQAGVVFILFGGGDAGGFYIDSNGKLHKIPPYDPGVLREVELGVTMLSRAAQVRDKELGARLESLGESLISSNAEQLQKPVQRLGQ
jgi:hypothetical protein